MESMTKSDILTLEDGVWNTVTYKDAIRNVRNQDKQKSRGEKTYALEKTNRKQEIRARTCDEQSPRLQ